MVPKRSPATRLVSRLPEPYAWSFQQGDHELRLYRWANPGAPRMLLVHGIGMGHLTFDRVIEALLPHAEIIAVDLPGFGDSAEPERAGSMADTAELVAAGISSRGLGPLIAVGHSMGAQVVAELCRLRPELVSRAVLFAPAVNAAERSVAKQALRMLQDLFEGKPPLAIVMGVLEYAKAGPRWFFKKLRPTLEYRIEESAPKVQQPVLVLCGSEDHVTPPEWCLAVSRRFSQGEFGVLEGPGHEAMIARGHEAASRVLAWVDGPSESRFPA